MLERRGPATVYSVCPHCGHRAPFTQHPLWWIGGSAGAGKTTLAPLLRQELSGYVVFEGEAIDFWRFQGDPGDYSSLYNQWLKVAYEIALNGTRVVFLGIATPEQLDACTLRSRFSNLHYLGLVCDAAVQATRLRARPAWRDASSPAFITSACAFTQRLKDAARRGGPLSLLDTTHHTPEESARQIAAWVRLGRQGQGEGTSSSSALVVW